MTTWPDFREAVHDAIVAASGLNDAAVVWSETSRPAADPYIVLTLISNRRIQPTRETLSGTGDSKSRSVSSVRDVAVQVRVEAIRQDAVALADDLQLALQLQENLEILQAECSFVDDGPLHDVSYRSDGRLLHARSFDLHLRIILRKADPTGVGTIGTVITTDSTVTAPSEDSPIDVEDTISEDD